VLAQSASQVAKAIDESLLEAAIAYYPFETATPLPAGEMPKIRRAPAAPPLAPPAEGASAAVVSGLSERIPQRAISR